MHRDRSNFRYAHVGGRVTPGPPFGTSRNSGRQPRHVGVATERTMHYQIGIAPDGAGEMQIICFGQTVMAQWQRIVPRALKTLEQTYLQRLLFGLSADLGKQSL